MSTGVPAAGELLCVDELERKLIDLSELVELKKEEVRSNFRQLHTLLFKRTTHNKPVNSWPISLQKSQST